MKQLKQVDMFGGFPKQAPEPKPCMTGTKLQCKAIIKWIREKGYITNKEITSRTGLGCGSATRRWTDLKDYGYEFGWYWKEVPTRYSDKPSRVKCYFINATPINSIYEE